MPAKNFEDVVRFTEVQRATGATGNPIQLPLVEATLITQTSRRILLSLLFDTGASCTTLRADLAPMLGLGSWDEGQRIEAVGVGGVVEAYLYTFTLEIFDKTIDCPILLVELPPNPLYHGLLGRNTIFDEFGFGFWESTKELYITSSP